MKNFTVLLALMAIFSIGIVKYALAETQTPLMWDSTKQHVQCIANVMAKMKSVAKRIEEYPKIKKALDNAALTKEVGKNGVLVIMVAMNNLSTDTKRKIIDLINMASESEAAQILKEFKEKITKAQKVCGKK
ncbi:MAG: hypothetical protein A2504_04225 [Bdellovibrionales bacterium RIFOXYD12_FULL_39_22]|nr:MAG: hypothetical protein A2385_07600 [Bdellovibrionales bacterium RIFOXYB1_FULL_39_21]OFZ42123.1 MAG: hypothetical protein A2485_09565 [Bdellovibrionales bacterium RIFOXYC12_FULL_39_17]OFZ50839.1 MAG: hypothetical protein A2404_06515 [Bdellovibrionales bacterium RIFOXYC1_FULL_39_130]OFZ73617.1 MAG: hypothetical protein A2451_06305 [Bdellovibrionales bacterium RIFOXYC2_FULL_39_8]OFZ78062.1 MAG: hypothetical protein A2560_01685 [Bdellovibrionales bacterium RIFOXYD1_FULL_39_84]OFZ93501.1 MAG: